MPEPYAPSPSPGPALYQKASKLGALFSEERRFWQLATALFCMFAVIKGLRAPGLWPLTQAQIDYSHGFIKRGLQGQVLSLLHLHHYHALSAFFFAQFAVFLLLLANFTRCARVAERFGSLLPVAIFASSYALTFLTHIVGYTDIPLAALVIALLTVRKTSLRFYMSLALVPLALLVHESFLLMFLPVLLFSFVLDAVLARGAAARRFIVFALALGVLSLLITLAFSVRANLTPDQVDQFHEEIARRVDFELRDDFFNVLSRSLSGSIHEAIDGFHYADWFVPDLVSIANLLPLVLLLLVFMRRLVRDAFPQNARVRRLLWLAASLAALAPLSMFLLGVDGARWNTAGTLVLYLEFLLLCRALPQHRFTISAAQRNAAILVLAINMASGMGLFDDETIHPYPFIPALSEHYR